MTALLLPAHAGVIPDYVVPDATVAPAPRARGGDPVLCLDCGRPVRCSPRTRG